jgi:hypothetical protein
MQQKRIIRIAVVVTVIALVVALVALIGPTLFDALLAMHGM